MKRKQLTLCAALIVALSIGGSAWAAENWAVTNGLWTDVAIWDQGHVPNAADDRAVWTNHTVTVDTVVSQPVSNIRLGVFQRIGGNLVIDAGAALTNNGLMQISCGVTNALGIPGLGSSMTINGTYYNGGDMIVGHVSDTGQGGILNVSSGAVLTVAGEFQAGLGGTGIVNMVGGTVTQTGTGDTSIGIGGWQYGELNMSDGAIWVTGDDLIVGSGAGNKRTGKVTLSGGSRMSVSDDLFLAGFNAREDQNGEVIVNDARLMVWDYLYVGRANTCTGTLTIAHADADVSAKRLLVADGGGKGTVNLLDSKLYVSGKNELLDNNIQVSSSGLVRFEKGILEWNNDSDDATDVLYGFWTNGNFAATKNDAFLPSFTNYLTAISYSYDLGDNYTAWVGVNGATNAATFVTAIPDVVIGDISIDIDGTDAIVGWDGTNVASYTLQSKGALTDPSWNNEQSGIPGVDGSMSATTTTTSAESFYRVTYP